MQLDFLFWFFLVGIVVAVFQDLKRKEVDNWLNLFLLTGSFAFLFYKAFFSDDYGLIFLAGFILAIMFLVMNIFYYGRIFGGGDAVLLFAMSVFFVGKNFSESAMNIGVFIFLLMISGSAYGILCSAVLYIKNSEKANRRFFKKFKDTKLFLFASVFLGLLASLLIFYSSVFIVVAVVLIAMPFVYVFAKSLEEISMVKIVSGEELKEGDWLVNKIKVKNKTIVPNWEGLSVEEVKLLRNKNKIKIKEGLPFVPAFLLAFLLYAFLRGRFF